jgi:hypothetical protein
MQARADTGNQTEPMMMAAGVTQLVIYFLPNGTQYSLDAG